MQILNVAMAVALSQSDPPFLVDPLSGVGVVANEQQINKLPIGPPLESAVKHQFLLIPTPYLLDLAVKQLAPPHIVQVLVQKPILCAPPFRHHEARQLRRRLLGYEHVVPQIGKTVVTVL